MNIHYLQHVPFEGIGSIERWADAHGHTLSSTRLYAAEQFPLLERFDMLVIMGGPMSIHDEHEYNWLKAEKWFIKQVIDAGKPVLGICLGAQLIADALGAAVFPAKEKEIGWFPVFLNPEFLSSKLGQCLQPAFEVFHWHGETFSLPEGAQHIASSQVCENQGFIFADRVIALQFHLETTLQSADSIIANSRAELIAAPYIQSEEEMLGDDQRFLALYQPMQTILDYLAKQ